MNRIDIKRLCYLLFLLNGIGLPFATSAESVGDPEDNISGLVLDRTITRVGHDFTRYLGRHLDMQNPGLYNLTVYERPSARWGNLIWVERDRTRVFHQFLSPSRSDVEAIAAQAAQQIHAEILRQELNSRFGDNSDLAGDEF